ncbi:hypothetical protein KDC22_11745 [Paenibacillus tritici]|uniref:hypothetical protein n=1 Tax=Paenibacillus tritici TaxID=1873425 RepID=UPI001BA69ECE|nr:hypothetical protein [Paenibacillus tritici]QUL57080.1 hypothetical protein KDC22_11745 [Paenibacillus tritici]
MAESIVLPTVQPYFSVYNWHANLQSIILNHPDWSPWIYSNYIQIYMDVRPEITFADFYLNNGLTHTTSCPFVERNSISRQIVKRFSNFVDFIVECIRAENYIYLVADISKISRYSETLTKYHEIFLYGYDHGQGIFFISDFIQGKYSSFTASFKEIEEAINSTYEKTFDHLQHIELWKYKPDSSYAFDIINVRNQILEYVNCTNSSEKYRQQEPPHPFRTFGLNVFNIILDHLQYVQSQGKNRIDVRPFYLLYIRYKLMCERLRYMEENKFIGNIADCFESYLKLSNLAQINSNLALKYQLTKKESIITTMQSTIQIIYKEDKELSERLLVVMDRSI